ncbi:4757_t:CDS:2, partial [Ambispora leptoticha]
IQRKFFVTINEVELEQLKEAQVEKNPTIHERNNLIFDFLLYSGLRINELVNVKHSDWQGNQLRILGKGNKARAEKAGIQKKITPHTFRRSFATLLYRNKAQLLTIQQLLGHSSVQTTEKYIQNDFEYVYADY